jgi:hypothetical protein
MPLRIHFERTGGFAGPAMRRACTVDADRLPAAEADELQDLVQGANLTGLAAGSAGRAASARPDEFRYRLRIDAGDRQHTVEFGDRDMPAPLRPLVRWLSKRAAPGNQED